MRGNTGGTCRFSARTVRSWWRSVRVTVERQGSYSWQNCLKAKEKLQEQVARLLVKDLLEDSEALDRIRVATSRPAQREQDWLTEGEAEPDEEETARLTAEGEPQPQPKPKPARRPAPILEHSKGRTFVLIVGCNEYADKKIPNLRFAETDARAVFSFYATDARSPTSRDRVRVLLGKKATRQGVLKAIRQHLIQKATQPTDTAVLYFAGHGFGDAEETYLACSDTKLDSLMESAITQNALQAYWSRIRAGTKLLLTDACHSGGLAGLRGPGGVARRAMPANPEEGSVSVVIAAAGANEVSAEDEEVGQGIFTTVLLNGLRGNADADRNGKITLGELKRFLVETVPSRAREVNGNQTPVVQIHGSGEDVLLTR